MIGEPFGQYTSDGIDFTWIRPMHLRYSQTKLSPQLRLGYGYKLCD